MKNKMIEILVNRVVIAVAAAFGGALLAAAPVWHDAFCTGVL